MMPHMGLRHDHRAPKLPGELIVRNGPDRGVSRGLLVPLTLVGSGESCDLRILDPLVRHLHCVISVTPEGPHLRSVGGTTIVNQVPASSRLLQEGDLLAIGDVQLEVRWSLPPAPAPIGGAIPLAELASDDEPLTEAPPLAQPARKSARKQWGIVHERGKLFRERRRLIEETNEQREEVSDLRTQNEELRRAARQQLKDLRQLRLRFVRRWKRQWTAERLRMLQESERLNAERADFEAAKTAFESERDEIERDRRALSASLRVCRAKRAEMENELQSRRQELNDREHFQNLREEALRNEQSRYEEHRISLGHEINALENRVRNLRESMPIPDVSISPPSSAPTVAEESLPLHLLAEDLADQRISLGELVTHVARTLTDARTLGDDTLRELDAILRTTHDREESLRESARQLLSEEARLETWQARLLDSQIAREREDNHATAREERLGRREAGLETMLQEWQHRRQIELSEFQQELATAKTLAEQARETVRRMEDREQDFEQRRTTLATRELAVEMARQELGEADSESLTRHERKLAALQETREAKLADQLNRLREAQAVMDAESRRIADQWSALAVLRRDFSRKQTQFDRKQYEAEMEAGDHVAGLLEIQAARALAERHAEELRGEISRLIRLTDQLMRETPDARRAA